MRMAGLLEVCADSVGSAVNAARGGADRIELCSALPLGGLSPDEDLFCMVRERVDIPVRVLLRPRAGDFLYDEDEFELLCRQASRFAGLGADGIVIGMLNPDGTLDAERMSALMACGDGLNDCSMIRFAGVGVAMQNAEPPVKEAADYVTVADNNHDGVAEAIEKFIF